MSRSWNPDPSLLVPPLLPEALDALVELMARHVHDAWGAARLAEGWRWGPERNDARREHPCLVSFDELPPEEQEYDRRVVRTSLFALLKQGWTLHPPGAARAGTGVPPAISDWARGIRDASFDEVILACSQVSADPAAVPEHHLVLARRLVALGQPLLAEEVAGLGLRLAFPASSVALRLQHVLALAAVRLGAPSLAADRLRGVDEQLLLDLANGPEYGVYVELRSLQGRVQKDLALGAHTASARNVHLEQALASYTAAAGAADRNGRDDRDGYPHVNAAAIASWLGRDQVAAEFAERAMTLARVASERSPLDPWPVATLAESLLLAGDVQSAAAHYRRAAQLAGDRVSDVASMRRQARVHARLLRRVTREAVDSWLPVPPVLVFTGHLPDRPDRRTPRLPMSSLPAVASSLTKFIAEHGVAHGFSSAGAGADLLFLELLESRGVPSQIVLPFRREAFCQASVLGFTGEWEARFNRQVSLAERRQLFHEIAGTPASASEVAFEFGNRVLLGLARLKARELETDVLALALWDGEPGLPGGTASAIAMWRSVAASWAKERDELPSLSVHVLPPPPIRSHRRSLNSSTRPTHSVSAPPRSSVPHRIAGILFADVVGFSRMDEATVPRFFEVFLGEVGRRLAMHPVAPLVRNTWGDGLFLVFADIEDTGVFALSLCAALQNMSWASEGLPEGLAIRVGVHAGPLFEFVDRVTGQLTLSGRHVTQAARIEPVSPPGMVYASAEFAALAASFGVTSFRCESVGQVPLAKGHGTSLLYVIQPVVAPDAL